MAPAMTDPEGPSIYNPTTDKPLFVACPPLQVPKHGETRVALSDERFRATDIGARHRQRFERVRAGPPVRVSFSRNTGYAVGERLSFVVQRGDRACLSLTDPRHPVPYSANPDQVFATSDRPDEQPVVKLPLLKMARLASFTLTHSTALIE